MIFSDKIVIHINAALIPIKNLILNSKHTDGIYKNLNFS